MFAIDGIRQARAKMPENAVKRRVGRSFNSNTPPPNRCDGAGEPRFCAVSGRAAAPRSPKQQAYNSKMGAAALLLYACCHGPDFTN